MYALSEKRHDAVRRRVKKYVCCTHGINVLIKLYCRL